MSLPSWIAVASWGLFALLWPDACLGGMRPEKSIFSVGFFQCMGGFIHLGMISRNPYDTCNIRPIFMDQYSINVSNTPDVLHFCLQQRPQR